MLIVLFTSLISVLLAFIFYKTIHKYNYFIYGFFAILAIGVHENGNAITLGYVPFGLFLVVMFTGVLDKGKIRKRLAMVRAEYAIIATILLLPHALGYLIWYLEIAFPQMLTISQISGILAVIVIVPLFITSFQIIRKKMTYKVWKRLHKASYVMYGLSFLHLLLLNNERLYYYIVIAGVYSFFKFLDIMSQRKKNKLKETSN